MSAIDFIPGESVNLTAESWESRPKSYRAHILLIPEEDDSVSAIAINLPGVASGGDSEEEAIGNVREAFSLAVASYLESGKTIPWKETTTDDVKDKKHLWIVVHV